MKTKLQIRAFQLLITMYFIFNSYYSNCQTIDQDHTGANANYLSCEESVINAQSFTAGMTGLLNEIKIDIEANMCPFNVSLDTIAFAAKIYDGNGMTGTLLTTQNVVMNIPYTRNLFPISFNNPVQLTANNQYTIELSVNFGQICDPPFIAINFVWYYSSSDDYPGGQPYSSLSGTYTKDFYFQTYMIASTGINENAEIKVNIYPNPASNFITIQTLKKEKLLVEIYSSLGEKVMSNKIVGSETLPINNLSSGIYFIKIISENCGLAVRKVQVIK